MRQAENADKDISGEFVKYKPAKLSSYAISIVVLVLALLFSFLLRPVLIVFGLLMVIQMIFTLKNKPSGWIPVFVLNCIILCGLVAGLFIRGIGLCTLVLSVLLIPYDIYIHNRKLRKMLENEKAAE